MPGKLGTVLRLGPVPGSEVQLDPGRAQELGQGSMSVFALKSGPGVKQMMLEPESVYELDPLENLEPGTVSELD